MEFHTGPQCRVNTHYSGLPDGFSLARFVAIGSVPYMTRLSTNLLGYIYGRGDSETALDHRGISARYGITDCGEG